MTILPKEELDFITSWNDIADEVYTINKLNGFWDNERNDGEMLALVHSELSEALEGIREGNPPDDKIPEFNSYETELADAVIRIMDIGFGRGLNIAEAIIAKAKYNSTRSYKHGKKF